MKSKRGIKKKIKAERIANNKAEKITKINSTKKNAYYT